ncbi:hypothetical protein Tbd_1826 [Thiobacillus denitrificans ATCC 25259]|uniref:DNA primase n=1 Tax=Thiobacillus denitrificans (strain ATCC 25259 / T1) TaxID=292415 RepID=Q3SHV4_THIDA|nr:hypothetical protein [Thiobacillus denitrificans]AAZ97779.1 hypothetical protein Tbd_1826 [Thiobacillus denitrificans ATCC 25259]
MSYATLLARLHKPRHAAPRGGALRAHRACCPCCQADGRGNPALSVAESDAGGSLIYCFKGCAALDVIAALGLEAVELYPANESSSGGNGGPNVWASAAALADAIADAAAEVLAGGGIDQYAALTGAVARFRAAARAAMRGEAAT